MASDTPKTPVAAAGDKPASPVPTGVEDKLKKAFEKMEHSQSRIDELNVKAKEDLKKIEQKYSEHKKKYFDERNKIIRNEVPHFWQTALMRHPTIADMLTREDKACLNFLIDLYVEDFKDVRGGYYLHFEFSPNPYFTNTVLTKEYHYADKEHKALARPVSRSTEIKWKEGMDLLSKLDKNKKTRKELSGFFTWFTDHKNPASDEIARVIKRDLWLRPQRYFSRKAIESESESESESKSGRATTGASSSSSSSSSAVTSAATSAATSAVSAATSAVSKAGSSSSSSSSESESSAE